MEAAVAVLYMVVWEGAVSYVIGTARGARFGRAHFRGQVQAQVRASIPVTVILRGGPSGNRKFDLLRELDTE